MAQQKIFKSRLSAKDFIKFNNQNNAVSSSPRWQYYSGGSQRIVIHQDDHHPRVSSEHFRVENRRHVTRVSVNNGATSSASTSNTAQYNKPSYQSRSLSDLRFLLPDVTSVSFKKYLNLIVIILRPKSIFIQ